jgi:glycerophosphoryl diester phosphodiesterase
MFPSLTPPYLFAHRGASARAPENTLAAFRLALEQGAPAIEFDVKLSLDGQVVVIHDSTVERTTDGKGLVGELPLAELKQFDAGSWFSLQFAGERIPTLEEVFASLGGKIFMNIELTNYTTGFDNLVAAVTALVKQYHLEKHVMYSSFFPHNLIRAGQLTPGVPRGQLALPGPAGWWQRLWGGMLRIDAEHPFSGDVTAQSIEKAHARGRRVHVWTVNDPQDMRRLWRLGVDGIFTDDPLLAFDVLSETRSNPQAHE